LRNGKLLNQAMFKRMSGRMFDVPDEGTADGQGLGFAQVREAHGAIELFGHNGATPGAASQLDMLADPPLTIVVLTNSDGALRRVLPLVCNALFNPAG
jgi:hypothetical protein